MDLPRAHGSLTSIPDRNTWTGRNLSSYVRHSSLVECNGSRRRQSLVELPSTAVSWDDRRRLSLVYMDTTQQWSLAECSTLHSKSEEIDTSSLSYEISPRGNAGPYQPSPSGGGHEKRNTMALVSLPRRPWRAVVLGQLMALSLSTMAVCSIYLKEVYAADLSASLNVGHYALLCAVFTSCLARRAGGRGVRSVLRCRGWKYLLIALTDVEAKYLLGTSLKLEMFGTTQLLSCLSLPTTVILSYFVLRARYLSIHIVGLTLGLASIGCLVWTGIIYGSIFNGGKNQLKDIVLSISGTFLFSTVTVIEEWAVKSFDPIEYLGMLGLFGTALSCVQMGIVESSQVTRLGSSGWYEAAIIAGYALIQSTFSALMAFLIGDAGATALHLTLITSHFYLNLIKGILLQQTKFHVLYTAHFIAALLGILCYASKRLPVTERSYRSISIPFPSFEASEKNETIGETTPLQTT